MSPRAALFARTRFGCVPARNRAHKWNAIRPDAPDALEEQRCWICTGWRCPHRRASGIRCALTRPCPYHELARRRRDLPAGVGAGGRPDLLAGFACVALSIGLDRGAVGLDRAARRCAQLAGRCMDAHRTRRKKRLTSLT